MSKKRLYFPALILSLALHAVALWILLHGPSHLTNTKSEPIALEIKSPDTAYTVVPPPESPAQPRVKTEADPDSQAFASSQKQRVRNQMVMPKKRPQLGLTPANIRKNLLSKLKVHRALSGDGIEVPPPTIPLPEGASRLLPPEIEVGEVTALNTDQYLYYSFFSRVNELIAYTWVNLIEQAAHRYLNPRKHSKRDWVTQIEVILNSKGKFEDAYLTKKSGMPAFDQAALQSFRLGRMFPHPPKDLIDPDTNKVHLNYSFRLIWDPALYGKR